MSRDEKIYSLEAVFAIIAVFASLIFLFLGLVPVWLALPAIVLSLGTLFYRSLK